VKVAFGKWNLFGNRLQQENVSFDEVLDWTKRLPNWQREFRTLLEYVHCDPKQTDSVINKVGVLQKLENIQKIISLFDKIIAKMNLQGDFETLKDLNELVRNLKIKRKLSFF
jgi:hypothetical protein